MSYEVVTLCYYFKVATVVHYLLLQFPRLFRQKCQNQGDREPQICEWMSVVTIMTTSILYDLRISSIDDYVFLVLMFRINICWWFLKYNLIICLIWLKLTWYGSELLNKDLYVVSNPVRSWMRWSTLSSCSWICRPNPSTNNS